MYWMGIVPVDAGTGPRSWLASRVSNTAGATHLAATFTHGYAVLNETNVVRWVLEEAELPLAESIYNFSAPIRSIDAGPYGNVIVVDSGGSLSVFGANKALDGQLGLLCDSSISATNVSNFRGVSGTPGSFLSVCVNGELALALSNDRKTLYACGRNPWTAPGAPSADLTSWAFWRPVSGLPTGKSISSFSCGHTGGFAVVENVAYGWGLNSADQTGTGRSEGIVWMASKIQASGDLALRTIASIAAGDDFSLIASRTSSFCRCHSSPSNSNTL